MAFDAHQIVDRRRLRRKLGFWRTATIVVAALFIISAAMFLADRSGLGWRNEHVARVTISGVITGDRKMLELIESIGKDESAKAILLSIDSPGGTTTGSEALFASIRKAAENKPVVAQLGTLAASGGYIAALAADHVVARRNTLTGSIGVIFQWANVAKLLETVGVSVDTVKSAPLKAEPNPFTPTDPEAIEAMEALVADSYAWFIDLVAERREINSAKARQLGDGRLYTGKQALEEGLIDAIGGEEAVRAWLGHEHGLSADLPIVDRKPETPLEELSVGALARWLGIGRLAEWAAVPAGELNGLVSVWKPQILDK